MTASVAPNWGRQSSIIQPREPAFWLYCGLLALGGYLFVEEQSLMSSLTTAFVLSWALVLAYAVPVALAIYWLDLFEREPKILVAAAILWGGVIATSFAAYANEAWLSILGKVASADLTAQWGSAIVGPGVEETLKLMGVVIIFLIASSEFDGVMDGFVYGAMVGLGFTVVEDVSYFINAVAALPGMVDQSGPVLDTFLIRVVGGGLYGHVLFTGLTGTGFAYFVTQRSAPMPKRWIGAGLCIAAGISAHVVWNSPWMDSVLATTGGDNPSVVQWIQYGALKGMPFLILLGILVVLATRSEEKNFRRIVAGEPDPTVINEAEIRSLRSLLARRSARDAVGRVRGAAGRRLAGRLQAAQIEYGMIRSKTDSLHDPVLEAQRVKIRAIRAELEASPIVGAPGVGLVVGPGQGPSPAPVSVPGQAPGQVPGAVVGHAPGPVAGPAWASTSAPAAAEPDPAAAEPAPAAAPEPAPVESLATAESAPAEVAPAEEAVRSDPEERAPAEQAPLQPAAEPEEVEQPAATAETPVGEAAEPVTPDESPVEVPAQEMQAQTAPEVTAPGWAVPAQAVPAQAVPAAAAPAWAPTHVVPAGGLPAWDAPDPARQPVAMLSARVELIVVGRAGAWANVRGVNGWTGWVDGRLLVERR